MKNVALGKASLAVDCLRRLVATATAEFSVVVKLAEDKTTTGSRRSSSWRWTPKFLGTSQEASA
jgi:hypothetical protein